MLTFITLCAYVSTDITMVLLMAYLYYVLCVLGVCFSYVLGICPDLGQMVKEHCLLMAQ